MGAEDAMKAGFLVLLPWVTLPTQVSVGAFRFVPVEVADVEEVVGPEAAPLAMKAMRTHIDQSGKPITSCTLALRPRALRPWDVGRDHIESAMRSAELLAFSCLSEQRFFMGHFAPHLNGSMFKGIGMPINISQSLSLTYPRRGMALMVGGRSYADTVFQQPPEVEGTRCEVVNVVLLKALMKARREKSATFEAVESALQFFLLANAESGDLNASNCIMLSAIAFERLLRPTQTSAQAIAQAFADKWRRFGGRELQKAKRVKPDYAPWAAEQGRWPIHRKWMKELYEHRSATTHHDGPRKQLSSNWMVGQHMVIAAFVFPLLVKAMLADGGLYQMTDKELGACDVLDDLLDSDWGDSKRMRDPEWSTILSMGEGHREWERIGREVLAKVGG